MQLEERRYKEMRELVGCDVCSKRLGCTFCHKCGASLRCVACPGRKGGKKSSNAMTKEARSRRGKKGAAARWAGRPSAP